MSDGQRASADAGAAAPLAHQAYLFLRQRIVAGDYAPGRKLSARRLVSETGIGATPMREGLTKLQHEGLLQVLPRRGYVVSSLTRKTIDDFFPVWRLVAPLIVELGVLRRDTEMLGQIERCIERTLDLTSGADGEPDIDEWNKLANERFRLLAHATGNPNLIAINERLQTENQRIFTFYVRHASASRRGIGPGRVDSQRRFLDHLRNRDGAAAAASTAAWIDRAYDELRAFLPSDQRPAAG